MKITLVVDMIPVNWIVFKVIEYKYLLKTNTAHKYTTCDSYSKFLEAYMTYRKNLLHKPGSGF